MRIPKCCRGGLRLWLKRCLCEVLCYRPHRRQCARRLHCGTAESSPVELSVIVCTYNRCKSLRATLDSLLMQTLIRQRYEIITVNNGEELPKELAEFMSKNGIRLITESRRGLSYARNTGGRAARGRYITYIDDDAVADDKLLESIIGAFETHVRAGIIGGQVILKTPSPKPEVILPGREELWSEYRVGYKNYREVVFQYEFPYGANFSVSRAAFEAAGGFNEEYGRIGSGFEGGEETELCFRVRRLGFKIGIEPSAVVYHFVDPERFTYEHVKQTIRAGIFTTYRLYRDGISPSVWNRGYIRERIKIESAELEKLKSIGASETEIFYKKCEVEAFEELWTAELKEAAQS